MILTTGNSTQANADDAVSEAWSQLIRADIGTPQLLLCNASANYPAEQLRNKLSVLAPDDCTIAGTSSCLGCINERGFHSQHGYGLSLVAFSDDGGDFGVGLGNQADNPQAAAAAIIVDAIADAGRPGELPDLIWLSAAPGSEEDILAGIASVVGSHVPVIGGSSADNNIEGYWWQFSKQHSEHQGILMVAMYPECDVGISFHSGYTPTKHIGMVTEAEGRTIHRIDHEPAAAVYNRWTGGVIDQWMKGGNILAASTFHPLGREAGRIQDVPCYALIHPEQVLANGSITLFSNISCGEKVVLMEGSPESLTRRAGTVANGIMARQGWRQEELAGALIIYCAGCMLGVHDHMDEVYRGLHQALGIAPFQGMFTFGEQGCFVDGINRHANLMISVIIFRNGTSP